jgi:signal transduction histidine kinase
MAKTSAEIWTCALRRTQYRTAGLIAASGAVSPVRAQSFADAPLSAGALGDLVWWAVTAGTALAALVAFGLYLYARRDERLAAAEKKIATLNAALDRTGALLDADDQRTIVWESVASEPQVFGGLPERVGIPVEKGAFLTFRSWLVPESAAELEAAADKLRRNGDSFQVALRTTGGAFLEASGRTSGRRAILRLRELTGERRSFAELKEQAGLVIGEVTALRALADLIPVPLWRRNRLGRLVWVNANYVRAVDAASQESVLTAGIELLPSRTRDAIREAHRAGRPFDESTTAVVAGVRRQFKILDAPIEDGTIGAAIDMSEIESIGEKLRHLTESHARTLDQLAAGVALFGKDGRILFHNAAFRAIWGLSADWLSSIPDEGAILDQLRADRKLPEQSNYRDWRAKHLAAYRSNEAREDLWHLPDGRTLRIVTLPNSDGGMTYIYENVTQEIMLESRLTALSRLQGETLDHLSEAVAVFGTDGRLRLFNPVFAEIWRLSPTRLKAEPHISEIIADCRAIHADTSTWDDIRASVTDLEHEENALGRMERPDGSVIDYATVALPEGMTMLTFVDVTDSARIARVLKERNEALEAADRLKSDFIQHVSYELRSPLQNILGQAELIATQTFGKLNAKQREYMDDIMGSSRELSALINDILHLATIDAGIMSLDIRETDIAELVASSVEELGHRLAEQKIKLRKSIPKKIGTFHADPQRVRQILFNLVSNAIRFSNAGGTIRIKAARDAGDVVFTVEDDGVGIPEEMLPRVFERFEGFAPPGRRGGAGVALSVVKSLVELHGGEIEIRSEEGKGTTAIVRLPAVPAAAAVAAE